MLLLTTFAMEGMAPCFRIDINRYCAKRIFICWNWSDTHPNSLRAKLVEGLAGLEGYRYCGHGAVLGKREIAWQDVDSVLGYFGRIRGLARKQYREYVTQREGDGPTA